MMAVADLTPHDRRGDPRAPEAGAAPGLVPGLARRVHLLGAGGAGLSGVAKLLLGRGHEVSGYDRARSAFIDSLEALGVPVALGESRAADLPEDARAVVRTAAIGDDDPQVRVARERGLPVLKYAEVLARLSPAGRTLAVAGTHGKTTTAWMLYHALAGVTAAVGRTAPGPGALVGGTNRVLGENAIAPDPGGWFAVEACEYDRSFLQLAPAGAIVTNLESDHLDYYGTFAALEGAFARFADRVPAGGLLVLGEDVPESIASAARCRVWRLQRELRVDHAPGRQGCYRFRLRGPGWAAPEVELRVPGRFNVDNAALALALATGLAAEAWHLDPGAAARHAAEELATFVGVERRYEPWGTHGGIEVVHDYAHHPTEVRATIEAARGAMPGKTLHVLFQPHQHSRTARFLDGFVDSLSGADRVVIADVYGARAPIDTEAAGAEELVRRLAAAGVDVTYGGPVREAARVLARDIGPGGAALVLGAGDVDGVKDDLERELALRGAAARGPVG